MKEAELAKQIQAILSSKCLYFHITNFVFTKLFQEIVRFLNDDTNFTNYNELLSHFSRALDLHVTMACFKFVFFFGFF